MKSCLIAVFEFEILIFLELLSKLELLLITTGNFTGSN